MRDRLLWIGLMAVVAAGLVALEQWAGGQLLTRLISLAFIWGIAAVALNLTNGTAGFLNLGQHGFMLVGAYVTALLTSPKVATLLMAPWAQNLNLNWLTTNETLQMAIAVLAGGLVAALFGLLIGIPSLRLRGDYLAIVTLGFGEAIRYVAATDQGSLITNGGLGIRSIPGVFASPLWAFAWLVLTLWFFIRFTQSSYGRALKAIREDELAASAAGIRLAYHKVLAFVLTAAFAGIAGGLYAGWLRTIDPNTFQIFLMTYLLVAVSVGGVGSNTGAVLGTAFVVLVRQYMQPFEQNQAPGELIGWLALVLSAGIILWAVIRWFAKRASDAPASARSSTSLLRQWGGAVILSALGIPLAMGWAPIDWLAEPRAFAGLRNVLLALCLLIVMIYRPLGLLGRHEFSWGLLFDRRSRVPSTEERSQDAWLTDRPAVAQPEGKDVSSGTP